MASRRRSAGVVGDSREYLQALAGSRGLKVDGRSLSVSLNTVSSTVEEYNKERKVGLSDSPRKMINPQN